MTSQATESITKGSYRQRLRPLHRGTGVLAGQANKFERHPARLGDSLRRVGALPPLAEPLDLWSLGLSKNYDVYALFIGDEELEELSYGQIRYTLRQHALMCVAPGQIGGKTDTGEEIHTKGWALLFDTELLRN